MIFCCRENIFSHPLHSNSGNPSAIIFVEAYPYTENHDQCSFVDLILRHIADLKLRITFGRPRVPMTMTI